MNAYYALLVAGTIFGFVSLMHLLRVIYKKQVTIGVTSIPMWVSVIGFLFPLTLSIWMFMTASSLQ